MLVLFCIMQVKQSCIVASHELHFQLVHHLLKEHISQSADYKVRINSFRFSTFSVCLHTKPKHFHSHSGYCLLYNGDGNGTLISTSP